ncbi:hypothetical protein TPCCA_0557a [Treponema paraluiscuniculi Cuniculi A]|uniref:Uncharacterized protein n=2 Tax=Treponema paraluiscuniculi TaxID=53435 RepID=F7XT08_TREPU|nr:hypothetical protein TPCCA_0557a [Treponema paraluiscuniculi Cuniculi A]WKC72426.1 hypothetical protein TPLL2_0557a [Treponema paraluiscuniculi]
MGFAPLYYGGTEALMDERVSAQQKLRGALPPRARGSAAKKRISKDARGARGKRAQDTRANAHPYFLHTLSTPLGKGP